MAEQDPYPVEELIFRSEGPMTAQELIDILQGYPDHEIRVAQCHENAPDPLLTVSIVYPNKTIVLEGGDLIF